MHASQYLSLKNLILAAILAVGVKCEAADARWEQCGWGGGGFYYCAIFHPAKNGTIYMGGDVDGVSKSEDHGHSWRLVNNGIADYGIFSLAVDRKNPDTVYAATEAGLCKSIDAAEHWQLLPDTGRKDLRITGEKGRSIRSVAVDPTNGNIIYAASPGGKVFKSMDGGATWKVAYEKQTARDPAGGLRVQYGKVNSAYFGGIWAQVKFPGGLKPEECVGFGFSFKGDGSHPQDCFLILKSGNGATYLSRNLNDLFTNDSWQDVVLHAEDFHLDPDFAKKNPDLAKTLPATPDWPTVTRFDLSCSGPLPTESCIGRFGKFFFATTVSADGQKGTADKPLLLPVVDLSETKTVQTYGNIHLGNPAAGPVYSVAVAEKDPSMVIAATADTGLVLSLDAGQTWTELSTPKKAANIAIDPVNPDIIYGSFFTDGIWKSTDKGKTWTNISKGIGKDSAIREVAIDPANTMNVYAIGSINDWGGRVYSSNDGGKTWKSTSQLKVDSEGDPTQPLDGPVSALSGPTNITVNPLKPQELFISANWRSCLSQDRGLTWAESDRGADISVITDVRFSGSRTYVTAMDEGTFASDDGGKKWRQLWPLKFTWGFSGHNWRIQVTSINGADRLIGTCSPWDMGSSNRVVVSGDGGKTFKITTAGLPASYPHANTMWGTGYARALAVAPKNPNVVYLGIDGDPMDGKNGGGVFKSEDSGVTWSQLPNQPSSRRMYYGLAVDPTDSNRIFWGACGIGGGIYRSEDAGATWKQVFSNEPWVFNLMVAPDGTIYGCGKNLWKSADHGTTWTSVSKFSDERTVCGIEVDPRNLKTIWISRLTWDGTSNGSINKTIDGGATWSDITGNIPLDKPQILRFNPETRELWAAGTTLNKLKQ